jgi:hypothetical protein
MLATQSSPMTTLKRGLGRALGVLLLVLPAVGHTTPILTGDPQGLSLSGWANEHGTFAFDYPSVAHLTTGGQASYSTDSSLFSLLGHHIDYWNPASGSSIHVPGAAVQINAIVQENGTTSGNLLGGVFTVVAGTDGAPQSGIAPGESLITGYAVDAAAIDHPFNVAFLFALTYTHAAFSSLGEYVTYIGPYAGSWGGTVGNQFPFEPWGKDWGPHSGFTFNSFAATHMVGEPPAMVLLALGLAGFAIVFRRKTSARTAMA